MFGLPNSTELRKQVPKTVIYEKFASELTGNRKKSFEKDISRIMVVHEISSASVNIREGETVKSIFGVLIELKNQDYDEKNILLITKLFGQKMLIILHFEELYRFAIYQTRLLQSDWFAEGDRTLRLEGLTLDNVWHNLVIRVSGIVPDKGRTLDEQIEVESEKDKLRKQIEKLETTAKRESQSKKKYEIHEMIIQYKKQLEEM